MLRKTWDFAPPRGGRARFRPTMPAALVILIILACRPAGGSEGLLADTGVAVSGALDGYSQYLSRGFTLDAGPVLQPSLNLGGYGANLNLWGSLPLRSPGQNPASDEIDLNVSYTQALGSSCFSVGWLTYIFPPLDNLCTHELFAAVALGSALPFDLTLTYYAGLETAEGELTGYGSADAAKSFAWGRVPGFTLTVHVGWLKDYDFGAESGNGGDAMISLKSKLPLAEKVSLTPVLGYTFPLGDVADERFGAQHPAFFGGVSFGFGN
jgi:hypothetical protein